MKPSSIKWNIEARNIISLLNQILDAITKQTTLSTVDFQKKGPL